MITEKLIKTAASQGLPALEELFEKLSRDDAIKGLAMLVILGVSRKTVEVIRDIVLAK